MQIVIAYDRKKRDARYAGVSLLGQAKKGEELLLLDVSEMEQLLAKRFPHKVDYNERTNTITFRDTPAMRRFHRDVYLKVSTEKFKAMKVNKKTIGLKTVKDHGKTSVYADPYDPDNV